MGSGYCIMGLLAKLKNGGRKMNIIENINERLDFDKDEICAGGEKEIEEIIRVSPVFLPKDYIEFLKQISGEGSYGPEFEVDGEGRLYAESRKGYSLSQ